MAKYTYLVTGEPLDAVPEAVAAAEGIAVRGTDDGAVTIVVDAPSSEEALGAAQRALAPAGTFEIKRPAPLEDDPDERSWL